MNHQLDYFTASLWHTMKVREATKEGATSTKRYSSVLVEVTRRSLCVTLRGTTVPLNLSREAKTFSCLLTSLPCQQVSRDTAWGGGVSHSAEKQSRVCHPVCLFLLGLFPNYVFLVSTSVWSRRLPAKLTAFWKALCCAFVPIIRCVILA